MNYVVQVPEDETGKKWVTVKTFSVFKDAKDFYIKMSFGGWARIQTEVKEDKAKKP